MHEGNGLKFCMLIYGDHLQNWLDFGHALLIFLIMVPLWLSETGHILGHRALSGERLGVNVAGGAEAYFWHFASSSVWFEIFSTGFTLFLCCTFIGVLLGVFQWCAPKALFLGPELRLQWSLIVRPSGLLFSLVFIDLFVFFPQPIPASMDVTLKWRAPQLRGTCCYVWPERAPPVLPSAMSCSIKILYRITKK